MRGAALYARLVKQIQAERALPVDHADGAVAGVQHQRAAGARAVRGLSCRPVRRIRHRQRAAQPRLPRERPKTVRVRVLNVCVLPSHACPRGSAKSVGVRARVTRPRGAPHPPVAACYPATPAQAISQDSERGGERVRRRGASHPPLAACCPGTHCQVASVSYRGYRASLSCPHMLMLSAIPLSAPGVQA